MRKTIVTLLAAAAVAAPFAHAEGTPITVELKYDSTLLATDAGAKSVLKSIKAQAKDACSFKAPVTGAITHDRTCSADLVKKAIGEIRLAAVEDGKEAVFVFASLESTAETSNQ